MFCVPKSGLPTPVSRPPAGARRQRAFTLNELLVVIALAVLVMALAVPAFNAITGSRTLESAENQISSFLASTRAQAIGLQEPRGVIFFEDVSGQVTLAQVYFPPELTRPAIDLVGTSDELSLPIGIGLQGVPNGTGTAYPWNAYAVIMFDGEGRLMQDGVRVHSPSSLYDRLPANAPLNVVRTKLSAPLASNVVPPADQTTNIGFVLYDKPAYEQQADNAAKDTWMKENAVPFLINRYNGTLLRGE